MGLPHPAIVVVVVAAILIVVGRVGRRAPIAILGYAFLALALLLALAGYR